MFVHAYSKNVTFIYCVSAFWAWFQPIYRLKIHERNIRPYPPDLMFSRSAPFRKCIKGQFIYLFIYYLVPIGLFSSRDRNMSKIA